ncbi:hypothetical protein RE432_14895 [Pusillimonas sp. SM2304]|uniref:hypothetical protein n=1 Tax=Pusillimonas sp. SM2304 TaxID=3073241 RepID=UPI002874D971|nr:hypothetical protein [Pusillimonas sp. SM2304]MDS1141726.1 hypothetical protein [Pusillimonas sp. SM2304]
MEAGLWLLTSIVSGAAVLFFRSFIEQRGKNTADLLDRINLTQAEAIAKQPYEQENARLAAELAASNQLRFAGMDRRLQAHQEAFKLFKQLWRAHYYHKHDVAEQELFLNTTVLACQNWWDANCLYLEPTPREAFRIAFSSVGSPEEFRNSDHGQEKIYAALVDLNNSIQLAVQLPPINPPSTKQDESEESSTTPENA